MQVLYGFQSLWLPLNRVFLPHACLDEFLREWAKCIFVLCQNPPATYQSHHLGSSDTNQTPGVTTSVLLQFLVLQAEDYEGCVHLQGPSSLLIVYWLPTAKLWDRQFSLGTKERNVSVIRRLGPSMVVGKVFYYIDQPQHGLGHVSCLLDRIADNQLQNYKLIQNLWWEGSPHRSIEFLSSRVQYIMWKCIFSLPLYLE